jgi:hypothetical protein
MPNKEQDKDKSKEKDKDKKPKNLGSAFRNSAQVPAFQLTSCSRDNVSVRAEIPAEPRGKTNCYNFIQSN